MLICINIRGLIVWHIFMHVKYFNYGTRNYSTVSIHRSKLHIGLECFQCQQKNINVNIQNVIQVFVLFYILYIYIYIYIYNTVIYYNYKVQSS